MLIATLSQAGPFLVPAVLGYALLAFLFYGAERTARDTARTGERASMRAVQVVLVLIALGGAPFAAIGIEAVGCAPDAYECPV